MIDAAIIEQVPLVRGTDGIYRVAKTRVTLDSVLASFHKGATAEEIADQYSSLQLADIYAIITHYLRHKPEIDAYLAAGAKQRQELRDANEARFGHAGIRERLLARRSTSSAK